MLSLCVSVAAWARHLLGVSGALFCIPIIARTLGAEQLGLYALFGTAAFLVSVADLGMGVVVQRAWVAARYVEAQRAVQLSLWVIFAVSPVVVLLVWWTLDVASGLSGGLASDARAAVSVCLAAGWLSGFATPYRALMVAQGRVRELAKVRAVASASLVVLPGFTLSIWPNLVSACGSLAVSVVVEAAGVYYAYVSFAGPGGGRWARSMVTAQ